MSMTHKLWGVVVVVLCICAVNARTSLKWAKGVPLFISADGTYLAHVEYETQVSGSLRCNVFDLNDYKVGSGSLTIAQGAGFGSVNVVMTASLTVGTTYTVVVQLLDGNGIELSVLSRSHECVSEYVRFTNSITEIPRRSPYELQINYSAPATRYFVVALKDPTDSFYLGSARATLPAGVDVTGSIFVSYGQNPLPKGQDAILRVDVREREPLTARYRLDRTEGHVVATDGGIGDGSDGNGVGTIRFMDTFNEIEDCHRCFRKTVEYTSNVGPNIVSLSIRDGRRLLRVQRIFGVPAGSGSLDFQVATPYKRMTVGQIYRVSVNIRPEAIPRYRGIMANQRIRAWAIPC